MKGNPMRYKTVFILGFSILLFSTVAKSLLGNDWPCWRGPHANGISTETNWNPLALKSGPAILWESNVGQGHSSVVVQGDYLLTTGNRMVPIQNDTLNEDIVFCLHAKTGKELWRYTFLCAAQDQYPGPQSTPTIDGSRVFTVGRNATVVSLDLETGNVNWMRNLVSDGLTLLHPWGYSASVVVEGNLLLLNAGQAGLALNKQTGEIVWKSEPNTCGYATPAVFTYNGKRMVAISSEKDLSIMDVGSGKVMWSTIWESYNDPIILEDGRILLTGGRRGKRRGSLVMNWVGEEDIVWEQRKADASFQNWIVMNGYAYGFFRSRHQEFQCINMETGDICWSYDVGMWGSFTAAGQKLIIVTGTGEMIIAEASPEHFRVVSKAKVMHMPDTSQMPPPLQCYLWTNPTLANGNVYVRNTFGDMVCIDLRN